MRRSYLYERGASDINMVVTVLVGAILVAIVVSCNRWVKKVNMERRGYIEVPADEAENYEYNR